jgi:hypothetical protein
MSVPMDTNNIQAHEVDKDKIFQLVYELQNPEKRESALLELSKKRETIPDLAPILWHSFGTKCHGLLIINDIQIYCPCTSCILLHFPIQDIYLARSQFDFNYLNFALYNVFFPLSVCSRRTSSARGS